MRYLGNKTKLLSFIDDVIKKHNIQGEVFADLFAGTGSVSDHFKDQYQIIANDLMYYSVVFAKAKLLNGRVPSFKAFKERFKASPFIYFNQAIFTPTSKYFIYHNYTPVGNRKYFTKQNAIKIDGIRLALEQYYKQGLFSNNEYYFLLASLLESVTKISNTSGTYSAYFKFWEQRSIKPFILEPLEMKTCQLHSQHNIILQGNINQQIIKLKGDIVYLDPPYTTTQYAAAYHLLETIARYDYPVLTGKTGLRPYKNERSAYSSKRMVKNAFTNLLDNLDFEHVLISYSNQAIIPLSELVKLAKQFALNQQVFVEKIPYREYRTVNSTHKGKSAKLEESIIYFKTK